MFVTSISGGSLPDSVPHMVYGPQIPSEKIPLICSQNLVLESKVPGSKTQKLVRFVLLVELI
jgi:hypothetical protein